jgi:hypothetical protein
MTDKTEKRAEAMRRAAEYRERAANYESLSEEAQRKGDSEMSIEFARKAAEEAIEASRVEVSIAELGE